MGVTVGVTVLQVALVDRPPSGAALMAPPRGLINETALEIIRASSSSLLPLSRWCAPYRWLHRQFQITEKEASRSRQLAAAAVRRRWPTFWIEDRTPSLLARQRQRALSRLATSKRARRLTSTFCTSSALLVTAEDCVYRSATALTPTFLYHSRHDGAGAGPAGMPQTMRPDRRRASRDRD